MPKRNRNSPLTYEAGKYIYFDGRKYQIVSVESHKMLLDVVDVETSDTCDFTIQELLGTESTLLYADSLEELNKKISAVTQPTFSPPSQGLPKGFLARAKLIIEVVKGVEDQLFRAQARVDEIGYTEALREIVEEYNIKMATYYNYRKLYRKCNGDLTSIAASFRRSNFGKLDISPPQQHFLDTLLLRYPRLITYELWQTGKSFLERTKGYWIDPTRCEKVPQNLIDDLMNPRVEFDQIRNNSEFSELLVLIKNVGRSTFYKYVRGFRAQPDLGKSLFDEKYGEGEWDKQMKVFDTFSHRATQPLQFVFGDHYLIDVLIVDNETRSVTIRLYFTAFIDVYTRSIVGFVLLPEYPCIESVQDGLFDALYPKTYVDGLNKGNWFAYGIPVQLFLDNAWAHHSLSLENLARAISQNGEYQSIDLIFRTPYMGRQGALIERFFGNLSKKLKSRLKGKGAIMSSHPKDVRNAAKEACLLYDDIYEFILEEVVVYQNSPHRELNKMTPNQKWLEAMVNCIPAVPPRTVALERLFWRMLPDTRLLTEKGISLFGMHYSSKQLMSEPMYDPNGAKREFTIRYQPLDISRIALFHEGRYVGDVYANELKLSDSTYRTVSLAEREMAKEIAKTIGIKLVARDWVEYLDHLDELTKQRVQEKKAAHKSLPVEKPKANSEFNPRQVDEAITQMDAKQGYIGYGDYLKKIGRN